jgi:ribose 1,5-bisphosphokinase
MPDDGKHVIRPIGPGRLALVVGPSGAGKDAVLNGAKAHCAGDDTIVFPRRIVTRPAGPHEDHDSLDLAAFEQARHDGLFAFWWEAHDLKYAIPRSAEAAIEAGQTVVCNVSRGIVDQLRRRYAEVICVAVTAPDEVLTARLAGRARASDGSLTARIARNRLFDGMAPDACIDNSGNLDDAVRALAALLVRRG